MYALLATISLSRIQKNAQAVRRLSGKPLIAVVKDDGYGHGAIEVANALKGEAVCFAVANAAEGEMLRVGGIDGDILVLSPPLTEEEGVRICAYSLIAGVGSRSALRLLARAGERTGVMPRVHLILNTGMNRYGFRPDLVKSAARECRTLGLQAEGVFSHLYAPADPAARREQERLFYEGSERVREVFPACIRHLSSTGGAEGDKFDCIRSGIALYGYLPEGAPSLRVLPAMKAYALVSNDCVPVGGGLGYAPIPRPFKAVHTVRAGYGDGLFREGLQGAVGKLCMDASLFEGRGKRGEKVLLIRDFSAYAKAHGTTAYETLVRIGCAAERRYV